MKDALTPAQIADLLLLTEICAELKADLVLIGAASLRLSMGDIGRFTHDLDLAIALDLDEFAILADRLTAAGWTRAPKLEHRWLAGHQTLLDLLPAGAKLRRAGSIQWPMSRFAMSLAGFEHVFAHAFDVPLADGSSIRAIPPVVVVLLKIIAYTEAPNRRAKDLDDIRFILGRYESESDRLFSDVVFDAELPDFSAANAFLLGLDLREVATKEDARCVNQFLERLISLNEAEPDPHDFVAKTYREQLRAFERGFTGR